MEMEADPPFHTYGADDEDVSARHLATHVNVDPRVTTILPEGLFHNHPNLREFICHDNVHTIHSLAFSQCRSLGRVVMRGVRVVGGGAFQGCTALEEAIFGDRLESLGQSAFHDCTSLESFNLRYARVVERQAFSGCTALRDVTFGDRLESLGEFAFEGCTSLVGIDLRSVQDDRVLDDQVLAQIIDNLRHDQVLAQIIGNRGVNDNNEVIGAVGDGFPAGNAPVLGADENQQDMDEIFDPVD